MGTPVSKEVDGMLVIGQNEVTTVNISPEQVDAIIKQVDVIRNLIIK